MEKIIETHPYLNQNKLRPSKMKILIIGTFPAWEFSETPRKNFNPEIMLDVPYGRIKGSGKNHLWELLFASFDLNPPTSVEEIYLFLDRYKIGLSDVYKKVIRKKPKNSSDSNLKVVEKNNETILSLIKNNPIEKIFCTSKIVLKELPEEVTSRFEVIPLPSPSGSASRAIAGLIDYKEMKKKDPSYTTYQYRLDFYRRVLR